MTALSMVVGDVVCLKTGGPRMVVQEFKLVDKKLRHYHARCSWFRDATLSEAWFSVYSLNLKP